MFTNKSFKSTNLQCTISFKKIRKVVNQKKMYKAIFEKKK